MTRPAAEPGAIADTSVAVAALLDTHLAHQACLHAIRDHHAAIAGHALFETFAVLTRLPGESRLSAATAKRLLDHDFPLRCLLSAAEALQAFEDMTAAHITSGAVYDALIAAAARASGLPLLTRDERALVTYRRLGIAIIMVQAGSPDPA